MPPIGGWRTGVYKWTNRVNGKVYVGSAAKSLLGRYKEHVRDLRLGKSHNSHLQRAWNKYGESSFVFSIIERCSPRDCIEKESQWIGYYDATNRDKGYNVCKEGNNSLGVKRSEETVRRLKERCMPPSQTAHLAQCNRDRVWKQSSLKKKSDSARALWANEEWRQRQIKTRIGKKASDETREKMRQSQKSRRQKERSSP